MVGRSGGFDLTIETARLTSRDRARFAYGSGGVRWAFVAADAQMERQSGAPNLRVTVDVNGRGLVGRLGMALFRRRIRTRLQQSLDDIDRWLDRELPTLHRALRWTERGPEAAGGPAPLLH